MTTAIKSHSCRRHERERGRAGERAGGREGGRERWTWLRTVLRLLW